MGVIVIYRGEGRVIIVEYVYWNRLCVMIVGKRLYIGICIGIGTGVLGDRSFRDYCLERTIKMF